MTEKLNKNLTKLVNKANLSKIPARDHLCNIIIAGVNAIPGIGGSLASLMESYIPKLKEKRLLDFIETLSKEIDKIKDKIRVDLINNDKFVYIFEKTFRGILENHQKEKIECYKAVFINALINKDSLLDEEKEVYLNILDNLTVRHLRILAVLKEHKRGDLIEKVKQYNPGYGKEDIFYIMDDLRNKGLVPEKGTVDDYQLATNFNQLSNTGVKFLRFISLG